MREIISNVVAKFFHESNRFRTQTKSLSVIKILNVLSKLSNNEYLQPLIGKKAPTFSAKVPSQYKT